MAKGTVAKVAGLSGWVFISVGFIVVAVSVFFYDTLKVFIAIGGFMTLYGLGKLSYDKLKAQVFPKEEDEEPINLDRVQNPYLQQKQVSAQQVLAQHRRQLPQQNVLASRPVHGQHPQQMQRQHASQQQYAPRAQHHPTHVQHRSSHPRYCHACGNALQAGHRFCGQCGNRAV